jgi:ribonuclease HI
MNAYLFVDGSSAHKDDIGAWAAVAVMGDKRQVLYGVNYPTTISRCELLPIIEGLRWIKANWWPEQVQGVTVYSDSEYTVKTLSGLNQRNKNQDLWAALDAAKSGMPVRYVWRERNSLFYMTFCDALCGGLRHQTYRIVTDLFGDPKQPDKGIPAVQVPEDL